jgi:RimJ/RimL family protein N-acetyltransferase
MSDDFIRAPLPERVETPRLLLRCWQPDDAPRLKDAIDSSLAELRAWMPWAREEPSPVEVLTARLTGFRDDFRAGREWLYGVFDRVDTRVLGGAGLHPRIGQDGLEIGYWIRTDATRRGYANEAAATLTAVAFEFAAIGRVEIRCDPGNLRSAAIPRRLGYHHRATRLADACTPVGAPRDTMVWTLTRAEYTALAAAGNWTDT